MLADVRKADTSVSELTELMAGGAELAQLSAELMAADAQEVLGGRKPSEA